MRQSLVFKIIPIVIFCLIATSNNCRGGNVKKPNVSGQFYSSNPSRLSSQIDAFLKNADVKSYDHRIEILIAPHAGYIYSGQVAAFGFKAASQFNYKTVVVIAPSHYYRLQGYSVWNEGAFQTPLGPIEVDSVFAQKLIAKNKHFIFDPRAFDREHSLEVELPFLQKTQKDFKIVPIIACQPSYELVEEFAKSLNEIIGERDDVLIVISTDMSHFHNDQTARVLDRHAIELVSALDAESLWKDCHAGKTELCGYIPVATALLLAKKKGLKAEVLQYANSGDVTGEKDRVVGYFSAVFFKNFSKSNNPGSHNEQSGVQPLNDEQKKKLLKIARDTIEMFVRTGEIKSVSIDDSRLKEAEGAFVTIHKKGRLRGCIGNIIGRQPLYQTVRDMAISSCSQDPRFNPVEKNELDDIEIEISVLSKPRVTKNTDDIKMGVHGVIVSRGLFNRGVFLPQVATETGWTKEQFMAQLCAQKAGLPADAWKDPATKIEIFTANVFSEKEF